MNHDVLEALETMAQGKSPKSGWYIRASHSTLVEYVGITGRSRPVQNLVVHPPRIGDHIRWMHHRTKTCDFVLTYYEVANVLWDVRSNYNYMYLPGEEGEGFLTVFLKPVKDCPGEQLDRAERQKQRQQESRRRARQRRLAKRKASSPTS